jgi:hypothetical protein
VLRKFFPRDKNYILENVQLAMKESLLQYMVDFVKVEYLLKCNPLGLDDDTSRKVRQHEITNVVQLKEFYVVLSGVYRFLYYGDNQLTFIFDGRDDELKYEEEWSSTFRKWVKEFCRHENFITAVLELTVFYPEDYTPQMAGLRMSAFITKAFEVKLDPQKGLVRVKVA